MRLSHTQAALAALALVAGCLGADPYRRMAKELSAPLAGSKVRIAVLPFRGVDPALNAEGEAIAERLLTQLYGRDGIELIERSRLQQVMSEMSLGATGALEGRTATEVGRLVGAQALVVGTLVRTLRGLEAAARVVDVATGRVLAAAGGRFPEGRNGTGTPPPSVSFQSSAPPPRPAPMSDLPSEPTGRDLGPGDRAPRPQAVFGAAAIGRRIYVFGGATDRVSAGRGEREAYSGLVGPDGAVGRWRSEEPLPEGRYQVGAAAWGSRVYAVGGYEGSPRSEVFAAEAGRDGRLGRWRSVGSLPRGCTNPSALAAADRLYVAGCSAVDGLTEEVFSAPIQEGGGLGRWTGVRLPTPTANCGLVQDGARILIVGGLKDPRSYSDVIYALPLVKEGEAPAVTPVGRMSVGAASVPAAVFGGRLWVLGGLTNGGVSGAPNYYRDFLESAPVSRDGRIGAWRRSSARLSPAASNTSVPVVGGAFYLVGGGTLSGRTDVVQRVPVPAPEGH